MILLAWLVLSGGGALCAGGVRADATPLDIMSDAIQGQTAMTTPAVIPQVSEQSMLGKIAGWGKQKAAAAASAICHVASDVSRWGNATWERGKELATQAKEKATRAMLAAVGQLKITAVITADILKHSVVDVAGFNFMLYDVVLTGLVAVDLPDASFWDVLVTQGKVLRGSVMSAPPCEAVDYGALAQAAYPNETLPAGWEVAEVFDSYNGFSATLYRRIGSQPPELCLAFRGTEKPDPRDWFTDIVANPFGISTQYVEAAYVAASVQKNYGQSGGSITLTGHSLGGGLAQYASLTTNLSAYSFNAAAPGHIISDNYEDNGRIINIRDDNDPLSALDEMTHAAGLTAKYGQDYYVDSPRSGLVAHEIHPLVDALSKTCDSLREQNKIVTGKGKPDPIHDLSPNRNISGPPPTSPGLKTGTLKDSNFKWPEPIDW